MNMNAVTPVTGVCERFPARRPPRRAVQSASPYKQRGSRPAGAISVAPRIARIVHKTLAKPGPKYWPKQRQGGIIPNTGLTMKNRGGCGLVCIIQVFLLLLAHGQATGQITKERADTIVTGMVVTMDGSRSIFDDGAVAVIGDSIAAVGTRAAIEARFEGRQTIDARGKLVLPGFINGHTHVPMTLFRGLHNDVTLNDWLYKYIFPAEAKNVNEEFVRWGTRLAAAEQI